MGVKVSEASLEKHFSKECRRLGLPTLKLAIRFRRGWPDRLVVSRGAINLVELKTETGELSPLQKVVHNLLQRFDIYIPVLRDKKSITEYLECLKR